MWLLVLLWLCTSLTLVHAQTLQPHQPPKTSFEGFCPGRRAPPLRQRTCAPFYFFAACGPAEQNDCRSSLESILDGIRADNTTWDCLTSNEVNIAGVETPVDVVGNIAMSPGVAMMLPVELNATMTSTKQRPFSGLGPSPSGLRCSSGAGCTALIKLESADVKCRAQNYFKVRDVLLLTAQSRN